MIYPRTFDAYFIAHHQEFFSDVPDLDWKWFKAQGIAESNLSPNAKSGKGAQGIMQIMPKTWRDLANKLNIADVWSPDQNIRAGICYMRQMWGFWDKTPKEFTFHLELAFAGYNAGAGHILAAQKAYLKFRKQGETQTWDRIKSFLPSITHENAIETINYVDRIFQIYKNLVST